VERFATWVAPGRHGFAGSNARADRQAAAECFAYADEIRRRAVGHTDERFTASTEARQHFVCDEECAAFVGKLAELLGETCRR
jgi:hypothetical protein